MLHKFFTSRVALCAITSVFLSGCTLPFFNNTDDTDTNQNQVTDVPVVEETQPTIAAPELEKQQRETESDTTLDEEWKKERAALLIKKAEYLAANNEFKEALNIYERVLNLEASSDIERKAAHAAFQTKQFQKSITWYANNKKDLSLAEKEELIKSMRYIGDKNFTQSLTELELPSYLVDSYKLSWTCEYEFISCESAIRSYGYEYEPIMELKEVLNSYESLGDKSSSYKQALLVGVWYKNGDYTTALKVGQNIIKNKPDYRPVLKIVGFSAYMVRQYNLAQLYLAQYKKLEPKDPEVDFILGLILFDKWDYETSNIYFNHAVLGGYKPKIVVERKLAYNYWLLEKPKNMLQVLGYLVLNDDATELDITNAIYLALKQDGARNAQEWIKIGLVKFPNSLDLLALQAWYYRVTDNKKQAQIIVDEVLAKNNKNLVALMQAGILAFDAGNTQKAFGYFQKAKVIDAGGNWSETIEEYLAKINT